MKVLHVLDHSMPLHSGYVFRTQGLLNEERASGIETFQLTSDRQGPATDQSEMQGEFLFYRTPPATLPVGNQLGTILSLRKRVEEVVEEVSPDLIHVHSPCLNGLASLSVAKRYNIPLIYHMRASWEDAAVSHGSTKEGSMRYRMSRGLETHVLKRADAIVTICEGLRRDIAARGIPEANVTVVPNAVDRAVIAAEDTPRPDLLSGRTARRMVGFFGSFYRYEGLHTLIPIIDELRHAYPDILLVLLGSGDEHANLEAQVAQRGLSEHVLFAGRVPHEQVCQFYKCIDVFVYPRERRRLTEIVTPLKPLEAMANGCLVVASDVGGHRELVEHRSTGLLFRADDGADLLNTLTYAFENEPAMSRIRQSGKEFVLEHRQWQQVAQNCLDLYENIAKTCNASC